MLTAEGLVFYRGDAPAVDDVAAAAGTIAYDLLTGARGECGARGEWGAGC